MSDAARAGLITQKLLAHSQKTAVSFPHILTSFLIERLVARLVAKPALKTSLVFKGGFVGLRVYHNDRFTVDLDALLFKSDLRKTLVKVREAAETDISDGVWFVYENEADLATQGEYGGVRQVFRAGLGEKLKNIKRAQIVNFDLGIGDPVTPGPVETTTNSLVLEQDFSWAVYPVETILAEKLHAKPLHRVSSFARQ